MLEQFTVEYLIQSSPALLSLLPFYTLLIISDVSKCLLTDLVFWFSKVFLHFPPNFFMFFQSYVSEPHFEKTIKDYEVN